MVFHNNNHINPFTANKFSILVKLPAKSSLDREVGLRCPKLLLFKNFVAHLTSK